MRGTFKEQISETDKIKQKKWQDKSSNSDVSRALLLSQLGDLGEERRDKEWNKPDPFTHVSKLDR